MVRTIALAMSAAFLLVGAAIAAEPIEGTWKRPTGTLMRYEAKGGEFCGTVLTGEYEGQSIGCFTGSGDSYKGHVNKLDEGKTYKGNVKVTGNSMRMEGCVMAFICKGETLTRQ